MAPRHLFLPDTIYLYEYGRPGNDLVPLRRSDDPDGWLELCYADEAVNTQVNDGRPTLDGTGREVTSSASQPTVVAEMLTELDPRPGERVLEIGTGTGWNAALLAHRVGAENVTTVEIDAAVALRARMALNRAGYDAVRTVTADGVHGWPPGAPYHRLIATVGSRRVPYAWIEQTMPGGTIVAPLSNSYQPPGIAVLTRLPGGGASGRLAGPAAFMALRAQRTPRFNGGAFIGEAERRSSTDVHPYRWVSHRAAAVAIGQRVKDVHKVWQPATGRTGVQWLLDPESRSWASVEVNERPPYPVAQAGPRRLFDEVEGAYRWWRLRGRPEVADWRITVGPDGQRLALD